MVEEPRPTKKVVKKVVKRTVPRAPETSSGGPAKLRASTRTRPASKPGVKRPALDLGSRVGSVRSHGSDAARRAGGRIHDAFDVARDRIADLFRALLGVRLPQPVPWVAAVVTGMLAGLVSVGLGWASAQLFTATRGTASGGNWGTLALVVVAFIAFFLGELLLDGFGVPQARLTSFLGVVLVLVVILIAFLDVADGSAAWILVPALGAVAFAGAERLARFASDQPSESR